LSKFEETFAGPLKQKASIPVRHPLGLLHAIGAFLYGLFRKPVWTGCNPGAFQRPASRSPAI